MFRVAGKGRQRNKVQKIEDVHGSNDRRQRTRSAGDRSADRIAEGGMRSREDALDSTYESERGLFQIV
ncbi:hypothetical protein L596_018924 [Steinernema carpocapsae]|uniref:Uncharacterized protein n=1 Tax=Steinernema carpocapsae TaxID=34508 RepID=A0A4V6A273_STECR|nr:hypothetical protein L596_018924 [Steinernema carpocapsae]